MKQASLPGVSNKKNFQIVIDKDTYSTGERCGYSKAVFEGEEVKGHVELELAKPEMVKCIRLQLVGYITKSNRIDYQDVLKYINNPENPGTLQKALKPMKILSIDSNSGSSSNNKNSDGNSNSTSNSKYDNITILVDYDVVLWGIFKTNNNNNNNNNNNGEDSSDKGKSLSNNGSSTRKNSLFGSLIGSKSSSKEEFESRKDMINHKFMASRLENKRIELPFSFKLCHISDNGSIPLPSSYKNGKCQIEYFLYATIHRPWPSRNSVRVMKLRVLQKIKIDIPKYISPLEDKKVKELKFMKYIKKGVIEMAAKIPQKAYCHRENIPIEITVNHLGMNRTIIGFAVGLYEICLYEDNNTKKFVKYSFKLISERFYEYQIKPGEKNVFTVLNFPIIDGNCLIQKKFLKSNVYPSAASSLASSNAGSEESVKNLKNTNDSITEDDLSMEEEEKDITKIELKDVKIPFISPTIDEPSRWPIKVEHKLRIVAISNEYVKKVIQKIKGDDKSSNEELSSNENENENEDNKQANNDYEEYIETDSQINIRVSPPSSPVPASSNGSLTTQNNNYLNGDQSSSEGQRRLSSSAGNTSTVITTKDLFNAQSSENQKYINENKKYGIILGFLSNGDNPVLPKAKKALDIAFDIVIGTMTRNARIFGKEFKLDEEIEDQYFNAILRKNHMNNKLKLVNNSNSNGSISKASQKKEEEPDITIHTRVRTDSSNDSLNINNLNEETNLRPRLSPIISSASLNKELPVPPVKNEKPKDPPQNPPTLPPRTNSPNPSPQYPNIPQQDYQYQYFPNMPQFANPQEFAPSAPPLDDFENPPPPYEYNPNINTNSQSQEKH